MKKWAWKKCEQKAFRKPWNLVAATRPDSQGICQNIKTLEIVLKSMKKVKKWALQKCEQKAFGKLWNLVAATRPDSQGICQNIKTLEIVLKKLNKRKPHTFPQNVEISVHSLNNNIRIVWRTRKCLTWEPQHPAHIGYPWEAVLGQLFLSPLQCRSLQ